MPSISLALRRAAGVRWVCQALSLGAQWNPLAFSRARRVSSGLSSKMICTRLISSFVISTPPANGISTCSIPFTRRSCSMRFFSRLISALRLDSSKAGTGRRRASRSSVRPASILAAPSSLMPSKPLIFNTGTHELPGTLLCLPLGDSSGLRKNGLPRRNTPHSVFRSAEGGGGFAGGLLGPLLQAVGPGFSALLVVLASY